MRLHGLIPETLSRSDHYGKCKSCRTCANVHHSAAREIKRAKVAKPAIDAPDPVCYRVIHKGRPEQGKEKECAELYAFNESARDQSHCYYREHTLEHHERKRRDCSCIVWVG